MLVNKNLTISYVNDASSIQKSVDTRMLNSSLARALSKSTLFQVHTFFHSPTLVEDFITKKLRFLRVDTKLVYMLAFISSMWWGSGAPLTSTLGWWYVDICWTVVTCMTTIQLGTRWLKVESQVEHRRASRHGFFQWTLPSMFALTELMPWLNWNWTKPFWRTKKGSTWPQPWKSTAKLAGNCQLYSRKEEKREECEEGTKKNVDEGNIPPEL